MRCFSLNYREYTLYSGISFGGYVSGTTLNSVSHTYTTDGRYTVKLTVLTQNGNDIETQTVAVIEVPKPTTYTWTGAHSQYWDDASNWSPGGVPNETDTVVINSGSPYLFSDTTVKSLQFNGGTISGTATLTALETSAWNGGILQAPLNVRRGAVLDISGDGELTSGYVKVLSGILNNAGTCNISGSPIYCDNDNSPTRAIFNNSGTCNVNSGGFSIYVYHPIIGSNKDYTGGTINNTGTFTKTGSDIFSIGGHLTWPVLFNTSGIIDVNQGAFNCFNGFTQTAGVTRLTGGELGGPINIFGGELTGAGTISGNVVNKGTVKPGHTGVGVLTIGAHYTQTSGGVLEVDLGGQVAGTQFDQLQMTGKATLGGTLKVNFLNNFMPQAGDSFRVLTQGTRAGAFSTVTVPNLGVNKILTPIYGATTTDLILQNIALSINDVSVREGNGGPTHANFTIRLSIPTTQVVTVKYATANSTAIAPSDYTTTSGTLTFAPGETSKTISVPIVGNLLNEINEVFRVNLIVPVNASLADAQGIGTIINDDAAPAATIDDISVTESNSGTKNANFTITLSAPSGQTVKITAIPTNGSARSPFDYTTGGTRLIFAPGQIKQTFSVPVVDDTVDEPDEIFYVILSAPVNCSTARGRGIGTIIDDDAAPSITIDDMRIGEGNVGQRTATFRLRLSSPSGQVVKVNSAITSDTANAIEDFMTLPSTPIAFTTGNVYAYVRVLINGDLLNEPDETFKVNLSGAINATIADAQALGTILNDDPVPALSMNNVSIAEGNSGTKNLTFTVSLSAPSGQRITVNYATANGTARSDSDYITKTGTLTFTAGQTSKSVIVVINGDTVVERDEMLFVVLSSASNAPIGIARGIGIIINDDLTSNNAFTNKDNSGSDDPSE